MKHYFIITVLLVTLLSCRKRYESPLPQVDWSTFNTAAPLRLSATSLQRMEGIYTFGDGSSDFGNDAAAKWSYTINGNDTTYHLSFFCQKDVAYFICEGKRQDSSILLKGYWRRMIGVETGAVQLVIAKDAGAARLLSGTISAADVITITGTYGTSDGTPTQPLQLRYARPLYKAVPLEIVAHRGGGRTSDLLPSSENSVDIIKMASRFGATGIEIDVRKTSDGVLVLYHDATLNERLIQKNGMIGPIENYSYAQLSTLVRLIKGERIPTLREALTAVIYNTPLHYVWLDTKFTGPMQQLRDMQVEFQQKAAATGRNLLLHIGIPDEEVLGHFKQLPNYRNIPSVNELTHNDVNDVNSAIWAPRFTLGLQNDEVRSIHTEGRKAFVWTLDQPANVQEFLNNGQFDGILSNYPSAVAYYYYAKQ